MSWVASEGRRRSEAGIASQASDDVPNVYRIKNPERVTTHDSQPRPAARPPAPARARAGPRRGDPQRVAARLAREGGVDEGLLRGRTQAQHHGALSGGG